MSTQGRGAGGAYAAPGASTPDRLQDYLQNYTGQIERTVIDYPIASMLMLFGLGYGLGKMFGQSLRPSSHAARWYDRRTARELGHRILDSLRNEISEPMSKRYQT